MHKRMVCLVLVIGLLTGWLLPACAAQPDVVVTDDRGYVVTVVRLGLATCTIERNGEVLDVATADLAFTEDVPRDKAVAVIHAPRTGRCALRTTPSAQGKVLKRCKAGRLAIILAYGEDYCQIYYNDAVGYVQTGCLRFCGQDAQVLGTGMLTYNGKGTGRTTVNVRNSPDKESFKIAEWPTGTRVTVLSYADGWYQIEHDGMNGYVMDDFFTLDAAE